MSQNTSSISRMKQPAKSARKKKPKGAPRRPLSAYNYFFREERERIVLSSLKDSLENTVYSSADRLKILQKSEHRKSHGKIAFKELAKMVATNWKTLDETKKEHYKLKAEGDTLRYREELQVWKNKQFQLQLLEEKRSHEEKMNSKVPHVAVNQLPLVDLLAELPDDFATNDPGRNDALYEVFDSIASDAVQTALENPAIQCCDQTSFTQPRAQIFETNLFEETHVERNKDRVLQDDAFVHDAPEASLESYQFVHNQPNQKHQNESTSTMLLGLHHSSTTQNKRSVLETMGQTLAELNCVIEKAYSICAATTAVIETGSNDNERNNHSALQTLRGSHQAPIRSVCEEHNKACWSPPFTLNDADFSRLDF